MVPNWCDDTAPKACARPQQTTWIRTFSVETAPELVSLKPLASPAISLGDGWPISMPLVAAHSPKPTGAKHMENSAHALLDGYEQTRDRDVLA